MSLLTLTPLLLSATFDPSLCGAQLVRRFPRSALLSLRVVARSDLETPNRSPESRERRPLSLRGNGQLGVSNRQE